MIKIGAVAQLGERGVRNAKVRGSIPLSSNFYPHQPPFAFAVKLQFGCIQSAAIVTCRMAAYSAGTDSKIEPMANRNSLSGLLLSCFGFLSNARKKLETMQKRSVLALIFPVLSIAFFSAPARSADLLRNFNSTITVNDISTDGNVAWIATTGGLARYAGKGAASLEQELLSAPDVYLTSMAIDSSGGIWIGSERGMLYYYKNGRRIQSYWSYASADWSIRDLHLVGSSLLVGTDKGLSLFDTRKRIARTNIMTFGEFKSANIYAVTVQADTIFLGMGEGFAAFSLNGIAVDKAALGDRGSWSTTETILPVVAFSVLDGDLTPRSEPASVIGNTEYRADSATLLVDSDSVAEAPSRIRAIARGPSGEILIGTAEHYMYRYSGKSLTQIIVPGMTFSYINRIHCASDGRVWVLPKVIYPKTPWWQGVFAFDEESWQLYNSETAANFGRLGDGPDFLGIAEDRHGNMWFGGNGIGAKRFCTANDSWSRYFVGVLHLPGFEAGKAFWSKCDAIAADSAGYLWLASWKCHEGALVCVNPAPVDPNPLGYKRFNVSSDSNITALGVDVNGRIIAAGDKGTISVITHDGTPLDGQGVSIETHSSSAAYYDMTSTADSITWIASSQGLMKWTQEEGLESVDGLPKDVTTVEAESDGILWLGVAGAGLIRYDRFDAGPYGEQNGTTSTFTAEDGLVHDAVRSIAIDKSAGRLWVATEQGVSQIDLGHSFTQKADSRDACVYPNPFSRSRDREIVFAGLAPNTVIKVYTASGQLIKVLAAAGENKTAKEWRITWRPPAAIPYGAYIFTAAVESKSFGSKAGYGKFLIKP